MMTQVMLAMAYQVHHDHGHKYKWQRKVAAGQAEIFNLV